MNDALVKKYCEYETLRDQPFSIVVRSKYGHRPTQEEASDEELSRICNEVLLSELKALALLPNAIAVIDNKFEELQKQTKDGKYAEYQVSWGSKQ